MKFGLLFANAGPFAEPESAVGLALLAGELGFDLVTRREQLGNFSKNVIEQA